MRKLKTIFLGTPDFAVATLEMLHHHPMIELVGVVSMPDRPAGRGHELKSPEVIQYCKQHKLPFTQTENVNREEASIGAWQQQGIDLAIVLAFAQFLGTKFLQLPKLGCFNIHTSLLPKYRGAAPIQYALWNGDTETGVSIQRMVKKMDAGNIVLSHPVAISPHETGGMLSTRLKFQAALSCSDFIEQLLRGELHESVQDEGLVTFAPTLKKEDGFIDFKSMRTTQIINRNRAMDPWPGTYCFLNKKRLKILGLQPSPFKLSPGAVKNLDGALLVGCLDGSLRLSEVQLEGKKRSTDTELLNGWRDELVLTAADQG